MFSLLKLPPPGCAGDYVINFVLQLVFRLAGDVSALSLVEMDWKPLLDFLILCSEYFSFLPVTSHVCRVLLGVGKLRCFFCAVAWWQVHWHVDASVEKPGEGEVS